VTNRIQPIDAATGWRFPAAQAAAESSGLQALRRCTRLLSEGARSDPSAAHQESRFAKSHDGSGRQAGADPPGRLLGSHPASDHPVCEEP